MVGPWRYNGGRRVTDGVTIVGQRLTMVNAVVSTTPKNAKNSLTISIGDVEADPAHWTTYPADFDQLFLLAAAKKSRHWDGVAQWFQVAFSDSAAQPEPMLPLPC